MNSSVARSLFSTDGSLLSCTDKHKLMATLEGLVPEYQSEALPTRPENSSIIIAGMAVVQELSLVPMKTCDEFAQHFLHKVERLSPSYNDVHLVFDRYDDEHSLKHQTRLLRYGKDVDSYHFVVNDNTQIKVPL